MFEKIPRRLFISPEYKKEANSDYPIPIGYGQTTSQPSLIALMIQSLNLNKNDKVLEIGTGSGFVTALLARLVKKVYTIELIEKLLKEANKKFVKLKINNIKSKVGNGFWGWSDFSPYDAIIVSATTDNFPKELIKQLKNNGKIVIPLGEELILAVKKNNQLITKKIADVNFVSLIK